MRTLCLDVGNRRIGVAVSDQSKMIARPLCILDRKTEDVLTRIAQLLHEQDADVLLVGHPINTDNTKGAQVALVEAFVAQLQEKILLKIEFVDERYSTMDAREIMQAQKRKPSDPDDDIAAAVILQRKLDEQRSHAPSVDDDEDFWEDD